MGDLCSSRRDAKYGRDNLPASIGQLSIFDQRRLFRLRNPTTIGGEQFCGKRKAGWFIG